LFCLLALLASQVVSGFASDREIAARRPRVAGQLVRWPALAAWWNRLH
jgi:hypothetical protein